MITQASDVIALWPDGPPSVLQGVGPKVTSRGGAVRTDAGRAAELHIFRRGNHGFGMTKQGAPSDGWTELFHAWLTDLGLA